MGYAFSWRLVSLPRNGEVFPAAFVQDGSSRDAKVLYLIRHAQGRHNVTCDYTNWDYFDCELTELGIQQATTAKRHLYNALPNGLNIDVIISSPLVRTLETATHIFRKPLPPSVHDLLTKRQPAAEPSSEGVKAEQDGTPHGHEGKPRAAALSPGDIPMVACELCRETLHVNPCDKRRSITEQKKSFPHVDFSLIESDEDVLWREGPREQFPAMLRRADAFADWLLSRSERHLAVVSHSGFLTAFVSAGSSNQQRPAHFANCEVRPFLLESL